MQITIGSKVTMHFALRLADGTVADSSFDNDPLSFVVGDGALDKGLELALIGLAAGLITGCIGAGGGFIIAPALMSAGIKGILAVGTDLFHIFAKAIMGSVIHRKLGNVSVPLAVVFLIGAILGATAGGLVNRVLYELNPVLSDAFITTIYSVMLGGLGAYALMDFLKARKTGATGDAHAGKTEGAELGNLPKKLQAIKAPPMITFDQSLVPGGRRISSAFLVLSGALVGFCAAIMGVGGGFLTFPIFVYMLGVSSVTTVGTDIFQIVFTAGYASISQYAIYGFIFYTLAMGMLLGSLLGIQIGAMVTKVVKGITIRGFYAMAVLAGFVNRIFALPGKLAELEVISLPAGVADALNSIGVWAFFLVIGGLYGALDFWPLNLTFSPTEAAGMGATGAFLIALGRRTLLASPGQSFSDALFGEAYGKYHRDAEKRG